MTKADKAAYDREYRAKNRDRLKVEKAAYFQRTYDPEKAAIERQKIMPRHIEYCRQPAYKKKKHLYDRRKDVEQYGEFAEAYVAYRELMKEIRQQEPDHQERYRQAGRKQWSPLTHEKRRIERAKERERKAGRNQQSDGIDGCQPQAGTLEHTERSA